MQNAQFPQVRHSERSIEDAKSKNLRMIDGAEQALAHLTRDP
jgi:hypothetical protein